ncbi:MAG: hypothetical protein ACK6C4_02280, partial [Bacteroidota bacterium]
CHLQNPIRKRCDVVFGYGRGNTSATACTYHVAFITHAVRAALNYSLRRTIPTTRMITLLITDDR